MPPVTHEEAPPPMPPRRRHLNAEEFAAELLDEMQEGRRAMLEEFKTLRREVLDEMRAGRKAQARLTVFVASGGFALLLVLVFGLLQTRGVDVGETANATVTVGGLLPGSTTTTTTSPGVTTETTTPADTPAMPPAGD